MFWKPQNTPAAALGKLPESPRIQQVGTCFPRACSKRQTENCDLTGVWAPESKQQMAWFCGKTIEPGSPAGDSIPAFLATHSMTRANSMSLGFLGNKYKTKSKSPWPFFLIVIKNQSLIHKKVLWDWKEDKFLTNRILYGIFYEPSIDLHAWGILNKNGPRRRGLLSPHFRKNKQT